MNAMVARDLDCQQPGEEFNDAISNHPAAQEQASQFRFTALNWNRESIQGQSLTIIGSRSSLFGLYAHSLGALSLNVIEPDQQSRDYTTSVTEAYTVPMVMDRDMVSDVDGGRYTSDLLYFSSPTGPSSNSHCDFGNFSIFKLTCLTNHTLYIETDWNPHHGQTATTDALLTTRLQVDSIVIDLNKYFEKVECINLPAVTKTNTHESRVLLKASKKRANFELMNQLPNLNILDMSLKRGSNPIELLSTRQGLLVLKKLPDESKINLISRGTQECFFNAIKGTEGPLVPPTGYLGKYVFQTSGGDSYMLFPYVGNIATHFPKRITPPPVSDTLGLCVGLRRQLRDIDETVINEIRNVSPSIRIRVLGAFGEEAIRQINDLELGEFIDKIYRFNAVGNRAIENSVIHNDMQLGNMIQAADGTERIIDIDLIRSGTPFTDFLCCAVYNNCEPELFLKHYIDIVDINGRHLNEEDLLYAGNIALKWVQIIVEYHPHLIERLVFPALNGLKNLLTTVSGLKAIDFSL